MHYFIAVSSKEHSLPFNLQVLLNERLNAEHHYLIIIIME